VSDGGPSPEDFAAAARVRALETRRATGLFSRVGCLGGCVLFVIGLLPALTGSSRQAALVGGAALMIIVGALMFRSAARMARAYHSLVPPPATALREMVLAAPGAHAWLALRVVQSHAGGETRWLAITFDSDGGGHADARWLPGPRGDPILGDRRVWRLPPDRARLLAKRLRTTLGPPTAVAGPITVRNVAPFAIAACRSDGTPEHVRGDLSATRPPEGDLWAELVEDGLALVDEARSA
jgi:hypothetical protein